MEKLFQKFARLSSRPTAGEAKKWLNSKDKPLAVDMRDDWEIALGTIEGGLQIPLAELRNKMDALPKDRPLLVICRLGLRGAEAAQELRLHGFRAVNLLGGWEQWRKTRDIT